ncbi:MAG: hypothetical protein V4638_10740 [Bacteroidota bacterium]
MTAQKKNSKLLLLFFALTFLFMLYSAVMLFVVGDIIPYLLFFVASTLATAMFYSLYLAKWEGTFGRFLFAIALGNTSLLFGFQSLQETIKVIYPISIWVVVLVIICSLQRFLEINEKPLAKKMRWLNYGLIIVLLPLLLMKYTDPNVWNLMGIFAALVLGLNLILGLSAPTKHQSK